MRINETFKKAAGLFYDFGDETAEAKSANFDSESATSATSSRPIPRTAEQIVRESPGPNLDEIKVEPTPSQPVIDAAGHVSYSTIYQMAGLPTSPFTAEQVLELLAAMPAELPMQTKRATVKVTIDTMAKTMGVTAEMVVADASRKLAALAAYSEGFGKQADEYTTVAEAAIESLKAEIERRTKAIAEAKSKREQMERACLTESDRLDDVLEFFSLDVAPSKYA